MAIAFKAAQACTNVSSGNLTVAFPTGGAAGDFIFVGCMARGNAAFTMAGGADPATLIATQQLSGDATVGAGAIVSGFAAYYIRGASDPADAVFPRTLGNVAMAFTASFSGVDPADPIDQEVAETLAVASGTFSATGFVTSVANTMLVMLNAGGRVNTTSTYAAATDPTTGWNELDDRNTTTGADGQIAGAYAPKATAGATGTFTAVTGTVSRSVTVVAALKPFVAGGGAARQFMHQRRQRSASRWSKPAHSRIWRQGRPTLIAPNGAPLRRAA